MLIQPDHNRAINKRTSPQAQRPSPEVAAVGGDHGEQDAAKATVEAGHALQEQQRGTIEQINRAAREAGHRSRSRVFVAIYQQQQAAKQTVITRTAMKIGRLVGWR